jgi:hypothetical protein
LSKRDATAERISKTPPSSPSLLLNVHVAKTNNHVQEDAVVITANIITTARIHRNDM